MKKFRLSIVLLCCLTVLSATTGCFSKYSKYWNLNSDSINSLQSLSDTTDSDTVTPLVQEYYFEEYNCSNTKYEDMKIKEVDEEEFSKLCEELEDYAGSGDTDGWTDKFYHLNDLLCTTWTNNSLLEVESYREPSNEEISDKLYETSAFFTLARTELISSLNTVLTGDYSDIASKLPDYIKETAKYFDEESSAELNKLTNKETELTLKYNQLIGESTTENEIYDIYIELVDIRKQIAKKSGYDNYADYAYECVFGRTYTPEDAKIMCDSIKKYVVPYYNDISDDVFDSTMALYLLDVSSDRIKNMLKYGAEHLSFETAQAYGDLEKLGLCDIEQSDTKSNCGFTTYFADYEEPFIFNAPYGYYQDYMDIFHEFGHFVSAYYNPADDIWGISDYDLAELQSQGMEIMFTMFYDEIFGDSADSARKVLTGNLLSSVIEGAMYDEFQRRTFDEESLTHDVIDRIFDEVAEEYGYSDYVEEGYWMNISHMFEQPFYYISYSVSALGALEFLGLTADNPKDAAEKYMQVLSMGIDCYYFQDAIEAADLEDVFTEKIGETVVSGIKSTEYFV
ncbi:MAG: hypothetical protein K6F76_04055 [Clostridiales bacterium]|nr:hypothetical protein [Clostridiales bacterium]